MEARARGIVCRIRRFGETSVIVHWITEEAGRVATMAKGARRPKSAFAGRLDLFVEADFSYAVNKRSDLHTLREVSVVHRWDKLSSEFHALELASCVVHELELVTEQDTPLEGIYPLLRDFLSVLDRDGAKPRLLLSWEVRLLQLMGLDPLEEASDLPEAARSLLAALGGRAWVELNELTASGPAVKTATSFLGARFAAHFGKAPKGRSELFQNQR